MSRLLARSVVLDVEPPNNGDHYVTATQDDNDTPPVVYLDRATWHDLGQPTQLTITIHPGDTLTRSANEQD